MPAAVRHAQAVAATGVAKFFLSPRFGGIFLCVFSWLSRIRRQPNTASDSCGRLRRGEVWLQSKQPLNPVLFSLVSHIVAPRCLTLTRLYCSACTGTCTNRQRPMVGKQCYVCKVHLHGCPRFIVCLHFLFSFCTDCLCFDPVNVLLS
jgi:hypothetical protein